MEWLKDQKNWRVRGQYYRYWDNEAWVKIGIFSEPLQRVVIVGFQVRVLSFYLALYLVKPIRRKLVKPVS